MISTLCTLSAIATGSVIVGSLIGERGIQAVARFVVATVICWAFS